MGDIRVSVDRGGTFCDVVAHIDGREPTIFKLLSEDPANYRDAPRQAIRRVLEIVEGGVIQANQKLGGTRTGEDV
ncbi:5-oxoprolinase (ATP-hydrolyzing) [Microdochium nivale]|nr:5-oxoprolinase (ATP-hydrolyzing) [Microdochium nivale]